MQCRWRRRWSVQPTSRCTRRSTTTTSKSRIATRKRLPRWSRTGAILRLSCADTLPSRLPRSSHGWRVAWTRWRTAKSLATRRKKKKNVKSLKAVATATTTSSLASAAGRLSPSGLPSRPRRLASDHRIRRRRRRRHLREIVGGSSYGRRRSRSPARRKRRRRCHLHDCYRPAPSDSSPVPAESLHSTPEVAITLRS